MPTQAPADPMTTTQATSTPPKKPLTIGRATAVALRVRSGIRAGYLGNNPGNQG